MTDEPQTPAVPPAAADGVKDAGQPALVEADMLAMLLKSGGAAAIAYVVTCRFCGQRHECPEDQVEPVTAGQGA